jgi:adenosylcobinamide kinase/adenosylcobinamide-phosphate guanylyltransferase
MAQRIAEHKKRRGNDWVTIEEPVEMSSALLAQRGRTDCALVDCLTIWLSNLLLHRDANFAEDRVEELAQTLPRLDFHIVLVTNELGWGIVPDNLLARQFRDLAGWANQRIAAIAHEVVLTVAGIPTIIKKGMACP